MTVTSEPLAPQGEDQMVDAGVATEAWDRHVSVEDANEYLLNRICSSKTNHITVRHCPGHGVEVDVPDARPYFEIHYGDSKKDRIETNDQEILCIIARNPYSNVTFRDLTITKIDMYYAPDDDRHGRPKPVQNLPDGTPSVDIIPSAMVSFGNLRPSLTHKPTEVAREVVLESKGAKACDYILQFHYCYSIEFPREYGRDGFPLQLSAS